MVMIANRYEPTGNAAWGGMGEVHECIDHNLQRYVMLKRVTRASNLPRLLDEWKALMLLRSRHVVELFDIVKFDYLGVEETGLILEKIEGHALKEGGYEVDAAYSRTLLQIASGLTDIHAANVIHRDIKPDNIMADKVGTIRILDFGLAREVGKDDKTRSIIGTSGYMAPELRGDKTIALTPAVDVFAFGCTALSLIGDNFSEQLVRLKKAITASDICKEYPKMEPFLAERIAQCVSFNAHERPSIKSVRDDIERLVLRNQHRAWIVTNLGKQELSAATPAVNLKTSVGSINIRYDGSDFIVTGVNGEVFINNTPAMKGMKVFDACVLTFGGSGQERVFATFDISRPEA